MLVTHPAGKERSSLFSDTSLQLHEVLEAEFGELHGRPALPPGGPFDSRMLGVHTMDRLCAECSGDFLEFTRSILTNHLGRSIPPWLEKKRNAAGDESAAPES